MQIARLLGMHIRWPLCEIRSVAGVQGTDGGALDYALNRALDAYYNDRAWFYGLAARIMRQDWSWNRPALDYIELYYQAMK
jgi:starch synthase